jgi:predicted acyltransferase
MNTTTAQNTLPARTQTRLSALALASVMTVAMLLTVNGLATSEATPAQLAHHQVQQLQQPV